MRIRSSTIKINYDGKISINFNQSDSNFENGFYDDCFRRKVNF